MSRRFFSLGLTFFLAGTFSCKNKPPAPSTMADPKALTSFYSPRKDDLFLLNGAPFSLAEFYSLQQEYPSLSSDNILRLAAWTRIALTVGITKNPSLTLKSTLPLIRPLLLPRPSGLNDAEYEKQISLFFNADGRKDFEARLTEELHRAKTVWNSALLKEIRSSTEPWG